MVSLHESNNVSFRKFKPSLNNLAPGSHRSGNGSYLYPGANVHPDPIKSRANYADQPGSADRALCIRLEGFINQLRNLSADRTCWTPRIFRIFRRPWQNCRTNRRISCRLSDHAPNRRSDCSRFPRKADPFHLRNDPRLCRHLPFWHLMACFPNGSWLYGRFVYWCTPLSSRRSDQNTHCCRYRSGYWRKDQIHRTNKITSILYKVAKKRNQAARMIKLPDFYLFILLFSCAQ